MPDDCSTRSWGEFVREVAPHRANPNWNLAQHTAAAARTHRNLLGSRGVDSFKRDFMERYGMRPPYEYVRCVREIGREWFWDEFNRCGLGDVHGDGEEEADSEAKSSKDLDEYKNLLKPRLKTNVQVEDHEWFIVFVSKATADNAVKLSKRVYSRIEGDFSSKKRERCYKVDLHGADTSVWEEIELKIVECIRHTLYRRVQYYEEEVRKLSENRFMPA